MQDYSFENFIINCCKSEEHMLRKFLRRILKKNGFKITEDNYKSRRGGKFSEIRNMLAIRGNPKVCLVSHTDVCRDHGSFNGTKDVDPIIKTMYVNGRLRDVIQDRNCKTQVGGDDRLGVAINTWIALNSGYDVALLFTTDEEIGLISASEVKFEELKKFDLLCQVDRGNHSNQLVNNICGVKLCDDYTAMKLLQIAKNIGLPRVLVNGAITDVLSIKQNGYCEVAVNMTCGYHNSWGSSANEYIDIKESRETMRFVSEIIKHYYLDEYKIEFEDIDDGREYMANQCFNFLT